MDNHANPEYQAFIKAFRDFFCMENNEILDADMFCDSLNKVVPIRDENGAYRAAYDVFAEIYELYLENGGCQFENETDFV